jgi:hypothetical protein
MDNNARDDQPTEQPLLPHARVSQRTSLRSCCKLTSNIGRYGFQLTVQMMVLVCFFNKHAIDYAGTSTGFFDTSPLYINWIPRHQVFDPNSAQYQYPTGNWSSIIPNNCANAWENFKTKNQLKETSFLACQTKTTQEFLDSISQTKAQIEPEFWNLVFLSAASIIASTLYTCRCAPEKVTQLIINFFTIVFSFSPPVLKQINRNRQSLCRSQIPAPCSLEPFSVNHVITDYNDVPGYSKALYQSFPAALSFTQNYLVDTIIIAILSNVISFAVTFCVFDSPLVKHIHLHQRQPSTPPPSSSNANNPTHDNTANTATFTLQT